MPRYSYDLAQALWHELAKAENMLPLRLNRLSWKGWDLLTNPGYVGDDFQGVLFVAKNPANGGEGPTRLDSALFLQLDKLRSRPNAFHDFNRAYISGLQLWNIGRYLREANAPFNRVAFINLVPWRTPKDMDTAAWREAARCGYEMLRRQVGLLQPRLIVVLGKGTAGLLSEFPTFNSQKELVERSNGDWSITPSAEGTLKSLKAREGW